MFSTPLVLPLTYQSQDISFSDWISILTLGLAPLIAHIVAGVPRISYLSSNRPRWHDSICHYNPTSIIWRYGMVTDRRIRARSWNQADAAATNALFWTSRGWDGSEAMIGASLPYCTHLPARVALFSREMAKTIIVTLQGLQAGIPLVIGLRTTRAADSFVHWVGVDTVFFPLAILGLLRLFSAFWLTDDYSYNAPQVINDSDGGTWPDCGVEQANRSSLDSLLIEGTHSSNPYQEKFRPATFWPSRIFRALYILPVLAMSTTCILYMGQWTKSASDIYSTTFTTTSFILTVGYLCFASATALICSCYFASGHTTTIIPCISSLWYKIYSIAIMALGTLLFIFACVETRKTPCGRYTSGPGEGADLDACATEELEVVSVAPGKSNFGLASTNWNGLDVNRTDEIRVYNFTGTCLGVANESYTQYLNISNTT